MLRRPLLETSPIFAAALILSGCSDVADTTLGGAGGSGGTNSSAAGSIASGGGGGTTGAGGAGGASLCAQAKDIEFGEGIEGDLGMTGQEDFYRFIGKKSQVIEIDIDAQVVGDHQYDPDYIDAVVTLYDADGNQIARNDNPIEFSTGDSRLYTMLPADGEYCVRVAECWTAMPNPALNCAGEKDKLVTSYSVWFEEFVDEPGDAVSVDFEAGNDPATANELEYDKGGKSYYETTFWGMFDGPGDVDVWSFTLPADLSPVPPNVRTAGRFFIMRSGPNESGSTADTGTVQVVEVAAPGVVLAEVNAAKNPDFFPHLKLGVPYLLIVPRAKGVAGANDFYFIRHYPTRGNPLEMELGMGENDTPGKAETLAIEEGHGYIEGDLAMNAQDVDHFLATVPDGMKFVRASCKAWGSGSGLNKLTVTLLTSTNTVLASALEEETEPARIPDTGLNGAPEVVMKIQAGSQAPAIVEAFYRCGLHFSEGKVPASRAAPQTQ
jgi:hypothetical protein